MKANITKKLDKKWIEITLDSLGGNYQWNILLFQDGNYEPVAIQDEKDKIANKIVNLLNKESN